MCPDKLVYLCEQVTFPTEIHSGLTSDGVLVSAGSRLCSWNSGATPVLLRVRMHRDAQVMHPYKTIGMGCNWCTAAKACI
jgi:hypothetical protein